MTHIRATGISNSHLAWAIAAILILPLGIEPSHAQITCAQDPTVGECELVLPPVCSRDPAASTAPAALCTVTDQPVLPGLPNPKRVQVNLKAVTDEIKVGGYTVETENYNGSYLSPVIEAHVGDTAAAVLENSLKPREPSRLGRCERGSPRDRQRHQPAFFPWRRCNSPECPPRK